MGQQFTISEIGLKLIKTYEGYRPVDRTLVSGQRVVGYGHRIRDDETMTLSKSEALSILKDDLAPFEDMVNENVYAPLSQGQFDALCSLAFNIGPKAFLQSDILRAINNGRVLDAASGFDIWRKSEIDGKTYVVDALVRRRAAEKNLFLRPQGKTVAASRIDLSPVQDTQLQTLTTADDLPVFTADDRIGISDAPYVSRLRPSRRFEDNVDNTLSSSEVIEADKTENAVLNLLDIDIDDLNVLGLSDDDNQNVEDEVLENIAEIESARTSEFEDAAQVEPASPIAEAASEVSALLDALIDDTSDLEDTNFSDDLVEENDIYIQTADISDTDVNADLIAEAEETSRAQNENVLAFPGSETAPVTEGIDLDDMDLHESESSDPENMEIPSQSSKDEAKAVDSAQKYIKHGAGTDKSHKTKSSEGPFFIMVVIGLTVMGGFIGLILKGTTNALGENGPFLAYSGFMIGLMVFWGALFYLIREIIRGRKQKINLLNQ